ncbi:MAG: hypothetical protein NTX14_00880 [Candidatus Nealsonbacteria bacterium]|nr:hypothetical protein [Candidatus Nealsonbacteria bacterium]
MKKPQESPKKWDNRTFARITILSCAKQAGEAKGSEARSKLIILSCGLVRKPVGIICSGERQTDLLKLLDVLEKWASGQKEIGLSDKEWLKSYFEYFKDNYFYFGDFLGYNALFAAWILTGSLVNSLCGFDAELRDTLGIKPVPFGGLTCLLTEMAPRAQGYAQTTEKNGSENSYEDFARIILDSLPPFNAANT